MGATEVTSAVAAVAPAIAAIGSVVAAQRANSTSTSSALAATTVAEIERQRRRDELSPEFIVRYRNDLVGASSAVLAIELVGPMNLDFLDAIEVSFRSDGMSRGEVDNVFGPVRFRAGIENAPDCVVSAKHSLARGEFVLLTIDGTQPHNDGWTQDSWAEEFARQPVRLRIACQKDGYEPWHITLDIEPPIFRTWQWA